jgi:hypothetical protein
MPPERPVPDPVHDRVEDGTVHRPAGDVQLVRLHHDLDAVAIGPVADRSLLHLRRDEAVAATVANFETLT